LEIFLLFFAFGALLTVFTELETFLEDLGACLLVVFLFALKTGFFSLEFSFLLVVELLKVTVFFSSLVNE
jgi:hypothetical protein